MRILYLLPVTTLFTALIHCITYSDFPQCAQKCIYSNAARLGGSTDDLTFTCKSSAFLDAVHTCEAQTCSDSDINLIFTSAIKLCEPVGGTIAIGLGNLSSCAQPGLAIATTESGCSTTNWTCICTSSAYTTITAAYESQDCSPADNHAILDYTSTACAAVGIQLHPPFPASSPSPTSSAKSVYDFPQCAQPCADAALLQSGCQPSDWECVCVNPAFVNGELATCELQSCNIDDQYRILNITGPQCSAIGEALIPAMTLPPSPSASATVFSPLEPATVSLAFPTGNVPGSVPTFSDLPKCAQFCATNATTKSGGSITDLSFLCRNGPVLESIGPCESALCSPTDQQTAFALSQKLCEPVGGVASIRPTINPSDQSSVVSAAYPTTTAVTDLDEVPPCAKPCLVSAFNESGCALDDVQCQCTSSAFANLFSDCQAAVCRTPDLQRLLRFTINRCGSFGITNNSPSILSIESDLAFGIPTSTDIVPIPTDLNNAPNDVAALPLCAQECISDAASFSGCSIHNLTCICTNQAFDAYVGTCETALCSADELQVIAAYVAGLCLPVPGRLQSNPSGAVLISLLAKPTYTAANSTFAGTGTGAKLPPKATAFTGNAAMVKFRVMDIVVGITLWLFWVL